MKKFLLILVASMAWAQNPGPPVLAPGESVRVVEIKQADPRAVFNALRNVLPNVSLSNRMIVLRGPDAVIGAMEEAAKKLDVPPSPPDAPVVPNIELTIQLLYGSGKDLPGSTIPSDLEGTVRQLKLLFPYRGYKVLETQILRTRPGSNPVELRGNFPGSNNSYEIGIGSTSVSGAAPRVVRLDRLAFYAKMPIPDSTQFNDARIATSLDAREGQKTVVGKTNLSNSEDALILVITPKVIE